MPTKPFRILRHGNGIRRIGNRSSRTFYAVIPRGQIIQIQKRSINLPNNTITPTAPIIFSHNSDLPCSCPMNCPMAVNRTWWPYSKYYRR